MPKRSATAYRWAMSSPVETNRAHWDEVTAIHVRSPFYATAEFRAGANVLDPLVRERIGDVAGRRVLHLQCHFGLDTLSVARMGAEVTGLDFSRPALETARALAQETGVLGEFVESEVLRAPESLRDFDLVFASWGAIIWIEDLVAWMRVAARTLKPGGRLLLVDGHPAMTMLDDTLEPAAPFTVRYPYDSEQPLIFEGTGDYTDRDAVLTQDRTYEWKHGLGRIVNAAIDAGFAIRRLEELDRVPWHAMPQLIPAEQRYWRLPEGGPSFPLAFALSATLG